MNQNYGLVLTLGDLVSIQRCQNSKTFQNHIELLLATWNECLWCQRSKIEKSDCDNTNNNTLFYTTCQNFYSVFQDEEQGEHYPKLLKIIL